MTSYSVSVLAFNREPINNEMKTMINFITSGCHSSILLLVNEALRPAVSSDYRYFYPKDYFIKCIGTYVIKDMDKLKVYYPEYSKIESCSPELDIICDYNDIQYIENDIKRMRDISL